MTLPIEDRQQPLESDTEPGDAVQATAEPGSEPGAGLEAPQPEPAMAAREPQPDDERESEQHRDEVSSGAAAIAGYHSRFQAVQSEFIDEPRQAVEKAASLVEEAVDRMMHELQHELEQVRTELGDGNDTERLRIALRRYRDVLASLDTGRKTTLEV
jgi:hypothetical protein